MRVHPWTFAAGLFVLSSLLFSAAAAVVVLVPVGMALGLLAPLLLAFYPAASGNFFLPTYGTLLAAVSFRSNRDHADWEMAAQPQLHAPWSRHDGVCDSDCAGASTIFL